ncbi:MAG: 3'(2'),5'-bisphosphate nucleotidase CysQ [bacterium]|nr:3'(2'),5'-bisphosphate nucleotidase CysQ [bacterium]
MRHTLEVAMLAARRAGTLILGFYQGDYDVRDKNLSEGARALRDAHYDPVTSADRAADDSLRNDLLQAFPDYGWLSEETVDDASRLAKETVWIVDPIDGTKEFLTGIPEFAVSIALVTGGVPVLGVIYNPARDELYAAIQGGGTFLNGKRVFCSETTQLQAATVIVSRSEDARGEIDPLREHLAEVCPVGSVAYKLAVVAAGAADLNVSVQAKNEWDVCAGDLLVREAGGRMVDLNGEVRRYNQLDPLIRGGLAAGNEVLADAAVALIGRVCR